MSAEPFIVVGIFGAPHGIHGAIKINSATDPFDAITYYKPLYVKFNDAWTVLEIIQAKLHGSIVVATVKNYTDRDQVKALTGHEIGVKREQLPQLDETAFYWSDLEGMEVINAQGITLGKVDHLFSTGANDVLVVTGEKRYMVPFIWDQYVLNIDAATRIITVDWDADF